MVDSKENCDRRLDIISNYDSVTLKKNKKSNSEKKGSETFEENKDVEINLLKTKLEENQRFIHGLQKKNEVLESELEKLKSSFKDLKKATGWIFLIKTNEIFIFS